LDENTKLDDLLAASYTYADIEARSGDLIAARARVRFVAGDDRIVGNTGVLYPLLLVAARIEADLAVRRDDPAPEDGEWVVHRIHQLLELAPPGNPRDQAYAAHINAELARRDRTDSPVTWMAVVEAWRHCPRPFLLGSALLRAGEACRAAGQVPEAAAALREAVSIGEQLGAAPLVEEALTVARQTHLRLTSDVPRPVSALGLTRREIDVLRLVAEGSSNSAIARTLFISPKTVSVHVSNILAKLEVSNRGQAAALAHRAGLLAGGPGRTSG
jgi:DNA-binding CsgD family transcriptional regulator